MQKVVQTGSERNRLPVAGWALACSVPACTKGTCERTPRLVDCTISGVYLRTIFGTIFGARPRTSDHFSAKAISLNSGCTAITFQGQAFGNNVAGDGHGECRQFRATGKHPSQWGSAGGFAGDPHPGVPRTWPHPRREQSCRRGKNLRTQLRILSWSQCPRSQWARSPPFRHCSR